MKVRDIKNEAKEKYGFNIFTAVLLYGACYTLLLNIVIISLSFAYMWIYGIILVLVFLLILGPINFSMTEFYLKSYKMRKAGTSTLFDGFSRKSLQRSVLLHLIRLGVGLLFFLALIVPSFIYALNNSMSAYILRANPKITAQRAVDISKQVMKGKRKLYLKLSASFLPLWLLCVLTLGLGFVLVLPYYYLCKVVFYKRVLQGDTEQYEAENEDDDDEVQREIKKYEIQIKNLEKLNAMRRLAELKAREANAHKQPNEDSDSYGTVTTVPIDKEKAEQPDSIEMKVSTADEDDIYTTIHAHKQGDIMPQAPKHVADEADEQDLQPLEFEQEPDVAQDEQVEHEQAEQVQDVLVDEAVEVDEEVEVAEAAEQQAVEANEQVVVESEPEPVVVAQVEPKVVTPYPRTQPLEHRTEPRAEHKPLEHKTEPRVEHKPLEHRPVEHKPVEHKPLEVRTREPHIEVARHSEQGKVVPAPHVERKVSHRVQEDGSRIVETTVEEEIVIESKSAHGNSDNAADKLKNKQDEAKAKLAALRAERDARAKK